MKKHYKSTLAADVLLDMEDAVAPDAKTQARQQIIRACHRRWLRQTGNCRSSQWLRYQMGHDDLVAVAKLPIDAVLLPKSAILMKFNVLPIF
ncbi:MAG: aldolase/citrate lyase family protein [Thiotrichaceae bacterium]